MNKIIGIAFGIIAVTGIGYLAFSGEKTEQKEVVQINNEAVVVEKKEIVVVEKKNEVVVKREEEPKKPVVKNEPMPVKPGSYVEYSEDKIAMASSGDVVLFFYAAWCPSCRGLDGDIVKNLSTLPAGATILKVDYDKETELKKKYGVTTQHTLVQVDKNGNLIKKWSGGSKLESLLSQIQ